jgi:hypothetical protein
MNLSHTVWGSVLHHAIFICPSIMGCVMIWCCAYVSLSRHCRQDRDWIIIFRIISLVCLITMMEKKHPIVCQGQRSRFYHHSLEKPCRQEWDPIISFRIIWYGTLDRYDETKQPIVCSKVNAVAWLRIETL